MTPAPPTLGAGAYGYPDWQKVVNWDGPQLENFSAKVPHAGRSTAIFPCSRYATLAGTINAGATEQLAVTFTWYADEAGALTIATRGFTVLAGQFAPFCMPNLGPFVQARFAPSVEATVNDQLYLSNRLRTQEWTPPQPQLLKLTTTLGGGASTTSTFGWIWEGPVRYFLEAGAGEIAVRVSGVGNTGSLASLAFFNAAATGIAQGEILLPPTGCQARAENTSGVESTVELQIWRSIAGAK